MSQQNYEYRTFVSQVISGEGPTFDAGLDQTLNQFGGDGWDLIAVVPLDDAVGFVFQRQKDD